MHKSEMTTTDETAKEATEVTSTLRTSAVSKSTESPTTTLEETVDAIDLLVGDVLASPWCIDWTPSDEAKEDKTKKPARPRTKARTRVSCVACPLQFQTAATAYPFESHPRRLART